MTSLIIKSREKEGNAFLSELVVHNISNCTENNPMRLYMPWEYWGPEHVSSSYD